MSINTYFYYLLIHISYKAYVIGLQLILLTGKTFLSILVFMLYLQTALFYAPFPQETQRKAQPCRAFPPKGLTGGAGFERERLAMETAGGPTACRAAGTRSAFRLRVSRGFTQREGKGQGAGGAPEAEEVPELGHLPRCGCSRTGEGQQPPAKLSESS